MKDMKKAGFPVMRPENQQISRIFLQMRKAPILFHYTNLAEGVTEQRLETDVYVPLA